MTNTAFKLAFRNTIRHKGTFFINLVGLATGLACALLIFLWVRDEMRMDGFHENSDRLFQVMEHQQYSDEIMTTTSTPGLLAQTLPDEVPEIEYAATIIWDNDYTLTVGDKNFKKKGRYVGKDFFNIFSFDLIAGQPDGVLQDINSMVLTQSTAIAFFGSAEAAIGQTVELNHKDVFRVSGVCRDVPQNSSLQFEVVMPYEKFQMENDWLKEWGNNGPATMAILKEGSDAKAVSDKIADFIKKREEESHVTLFLQPYAQRYLYGRFENGTPAGGRIDYVKLFSIIAIFILLIACINFMNLSTARASRRAKEVGLKKAVGFERGQLIRQYLSESTIIAFISLLFALLLVVLFLPKFNLMTDKQIQFRFSFDLLLVFAGITIFTGLLAGSYPAFYLSAFKPAEVLKGEIQTSWGELWARRGLVVFQFTLSVVLIVAVMVVYRQLQFMQNKNLGYDKTNLIRFSMEGKLENQSDAFLGEAKNLPGIEQISSIGHNLVGRQNNTSGLNWEGKNPNDLILFENVTVNYDLLETIGVELKEGRSFSRQYGADSNKIIFNEKAIEVMGFQDNPTGKKIRLWDEYDMEIIGVVKDFHFQSLHEGMNPLFFRLNPRNTWNVMARLAPGRTQEALNNLKDFYERFNPGFAFDYEFIDKEYAQQYAAEQRVASLSRYFAGFAVLISCLGLLGLAAFTADRRKKEIGIRKTLGASATNIVSLLTRDFTKLVLISVVIGLPVSFLLVRSWLNRFAYHIDLSIWFFVLAGLTVLLISWLTVSTQAIRSANVNPKDCLKEE